MAATSSTWWSAAEEVVARLPAMASAATAYDALGMPRRAQLPGSRLRVASPTALRPSKVGHQFVILPVVVYKSQQ